MDNIVTVTQLSLAVIQYFVAAVLIGAAAFSAWTAEKSKLLIPAAVIAVLGLNSQAFAKGQPTSEEAFCRVQRQVWCLHPKLAKGGDFHLNSYYQQAMAVTTQAFAVSSSGGLGHAGGSFHPPVFAPPPVYNNPAPVFNPSESYTIPEPRETPVSPASPGSVFGNG